MRNFDGQQLFAMVQRILTNSKPYIGAQDGSYEASLYYHSCEEVERLRRESEALEVEAANNLIDDYLVTTGLMPTDI